MDRPDTDPPEGPRSGSPLLRPAIPPRGVAPGPRASAERSLGPFSPVARRPQTAPEPPAHEEELEGEVTAPIDELPWAVLDAPLWDEESAERVAEAPAEPASGFTEPGEAHALPDEAEWLEVEAAGDEPIGEDALEPLADAAEPGQEPLLGEELLAPPEWEYGFEEAVPTEPPPPIQLAEPSPPPAATPQAAVSHPLEDVAARLEQIARSLRGRSPADLLSGASDPLQVLIAGYALGLEAARKAQGGPHEEE